MDRHGKKKKVHLHAPGKRVSSSSSSSSEWDEREDFQVVETPPTWSLSRGSGAGAKKRLSKQMSMRETTREAAWEKRRRQFMMRMRVMNSGDGEEAGEEGGGEKVEKAKGNMHKVRSLTDEDLDELRGSIELGFGFNEEDGGQDLRDTLPALDLYFAVNRQFSYPKIHSPGSASSSSMAGGGGSSSSQDSPKSPGSDSWKLLNPGDDPQHVKTRLRHWAQAVACSVRQCC